MSHLKFDDVSLVYETGAGRLHALDHIHLTVEAGEFIAIVGPSGCGKSSLLKLAVGILAPTTGRILYMGEIMAGINTDAGMMFQSPGLYPWLSVRGNIELGPRLRGIPPQQRRVMSDRYLEYMGLTEFANYRCYELSGGMKQRVALARTLINDPSILLMDEPFASLDKMTREDMQQLVLTLWRETGKTFLFVTHDIDEAAKMGTRVVTMSPRPGTILSDTVTAAPTAAGELSSDS